MGRTWIQGRTSVLRDVFKWEARIIYNANWDGCQDLWKESYRKAKLYRSIDRPIVSPDPKRLEYERQYREREKAKADRFNRAQQKRYEAWLKKREVA